METKIKSLYENHQGLHSVDLFGYTSRGIPGLEIIGLGHRGKLLKEKFIFLGKRRNFFYPPLRYVLCFEQSSQLGRINYQEFHDYFELPLLLLFWNLAGLLKIHNFDHCYGAGHVSSDGTLSLLQLMDEEWQQIKQTHQQETNITPIFIGLTNTLPPYSPQRILCLKGLLFNVPSIKYQIESRRNLMNSVAKIK